jgi:outer membrane immunogenic protein
MGRIKGIAFGFVAAILSGSASMAADSIAYGTTASGAELPVHDNTDVNWDGFYAGIYGVGQGTSGGDVGLGLGVEAGVNLGFDFFLVGAEVAVHGVGNDTDSTAYGQIVGRAGLIVTDDLVAYASAGYGMELGDAAANHLLLGGGLEVAVTDNFSVDAQYLHGFETGEGDSMNQVTLGANFHF